MNVFLLTRGSEFKMADYVSVQKLCEDFGIELTAVGDLVKPENLLRFPEPPQLPEHLEKKLTPLSRLLENCDQVKRVASLWTNCQVPNQADTSEASEAANRATNFVTLDVPNSTQQESFSSHANSEDTNIQTIGEQHNNAIPVRKMWNKKRWYECSVCGLQKGTRAGVIAHINSLLGKYISCTKCAFKSMNPDCARQHQKSCGKNILQCDHCKFHTYKTSTFKRHALVHSQKKAWECALCHKKFTLKFNLDRHVRVCTAK